MEEQLMIAATPGEKQEPRHLERRAAELAPGFSVMWGGCVSLEVGHGWPTGPESVATDGATD